jgi:hypothetical protein
MRRVLMRNSIPLSRALSPLTWGDGTLPLTPILASLACGEGDKREPALAPSYGERDGLRGIMNAVRGSSAC